MKEIELLKKEIENLKKEFENRPTYEEVQKMINELKDWVIRTLPAC